jgi:hypothetical protein
MSQLRDCFEGVVPSVIATLDGKGVPNVSYASQVYLVDDDHVALSNQFFSKTIANVRETGRATALVVDPKMGAQYELDLQFERAEESGETFERLSAHLQAMLAHHGEGIPWGLRSADIFKVLECRPTPPANSIPEPRTSAPESLPQAARLVRRLALEADPDAMLDHVLQALTRDFGYSNVIVLVMDGAGERLTTLASRGYRLGGVGSEASVGQGAIGVAAATGRPVRLSDMAIGRRFAAAVLGEAEADARRTVVLPGLEAPHSQLAVPMISQGKVRGVLFAEDMERFRFTQDDEDALAVVAAQLAASLRLWGPEGGPRPARAAVPSAATGPAFRVRYYAFDNSVFIEDAYLIKGVPGRLLFYFLTVFAETGRTDFSNRELRLDAALRLPDLKDNLETRLILLRRRLDEKGAPVRLARPSRGHIRLELAGLPRLEVVRDAG